MYNCICTYSTKSVKRQSTYQGASWFQRTFVNANSWTSWFPKCYGFNIEERFRNNVIIESFLNQTRIDHVFVFEQGPVFPFTPQDHSTTTTSQTAHVSTAPHVSTLSPSQCGPFSRSNFYADASASMATPGNSVRRPSVLSPAPMAEFAFVRTCVIVPKCSQERPVKNVSQLR